MSEVRYVSLFSGIEAATVAWEPLGWEPLCFAEFDEFPSAVLAERYPNVSNIGDVTKVKWKKYRGKCDLVVGGSPCQSFSIAGKREGLQGESGLMFEYIRAVHEIRPRWFLWENVPGALSSEGGEAFRQLLSEMDKLGYGLAWRILDAQFFGVAQRRRRLFLVGRLGACPPVEVLFESEGMRGDYPSSREKRKGLAAAAVRGVASADLDADETDAGCLNPEDPQSKRIFATDSCGPTLSSGTNEGMNIQPSVLVKKRTLAFNEANITSKQNAANPDWDDECHTLSTDSRNDVVIKVQRHALVLEPIAMADTNARAAIDENMVGTLHFGGDSPTAAIPINETATNDAEEGQMVVRRLTPLECERLQGFPDNYTKIPYRGKPAEECPDGPRYKAIGNSMAVPVMRWIGGRIEKSADGLVVTDDYQARREVPSRG